MLASYSKDDGFKTIFSSLTKIKEVSPEVESQVSKLAQTLITDANNTAVAFKITDKNIIGFMGSMQKSGIVYKTSGEALAGYQAYLKTTGTATTIATVKTTALTVAMKLLSTVGWMALITAATWAIGKLVTAIDDAVESTEEAKETLSELQTEFEDATQEAESITSELEDVRKKIEEINNLDGAKVTKDGELQTLKEQEASLERQLAIEKERADLAKQEATQKAEKVLGAKSQSEITPTVMETYKVYGRDSRSATDYTEQTRNVNNYLTTSELLNEATSEIEKQQKALDDLIQKKDELTSTNQTETEEYRTLLDSIADTTSAMDKARTIAEEQNRIINESIVGIDETSETYLKNKEASDRYADSLVDLSVAENEVAENTPKADAVSYEPLDISAFKDSIKEIESGYQSLLDAKQEYEDNGGFLSPSTIANLTESGLIQYLEQTSEGIEFNTEKYAENSAIMKQNAIQKLYSAMCSDVEAIAIGNTSKVSEIAQTAIANAGNSAETASTKASNAASGWYEYGASLSFVKSAMSDEVQGATGTTKAQIDATIKSYQNLANIVNGIDVAQTTTAKNADKSAKSATKSAEDAAKAMKEIVEKQLALFKAELDAGLVDFKTYVDKCTAYLDEAYSSGKITGSDYWANMKTVYENQLDVYKKVLSAVTRRYDKEIASIEDVIADIEKQNDALEKQKDKYDAALSAINSLIDAKKEELQISVDALEKENDDIEEQISKYEALITVTGKVYDDEISSLTEQQNALQEKIDSLNDEADAYDLIRRKEDALYALERAQNQRTKKVMVNGEFVYKNNDADIKTAKDNLYDIKKEEIVSQIEKEKDNLQESIDLLEEYKNKWAEITDAHTKAANEQIAIDLMGQDYQSKILANRTTDIETFRDLYLASNNMIDDNTSLISSYNQKVTYYDKLSSKWDKLASIKKETENRQIAAEILGANWENDILNDRSANYEGFKNEYLTIQKQIDNNTSMINSYNEKISYYENLKKQWANIADIYEQSVEDQYAAMLLGQNWESDVLNGRINTLTSFQNEYIAIQQSIIDAAWNSANEQIKAAQEAQKAAEGAQNSAPTISTTQVTKYKVVDTSTGRDLIKGFTSDSSAYRWIHNVDDELYDPDKLKVASYAKGGMVPKVGSTLPDRIAKSLGEDHIGTLAWKEGERILTPKQNGYWEKWTDAMPELIALTNPLRDIAKNQHKISNLTTNNNKQTVMQFTGDLEFPNIKSGDDAQKLVYELQHLRLDNQQFLARKK